jgi:hypothetical protein
MNDEKSALIALESLRKTLEKNRISAKNSKIIQATGTHLKISCRGIRFEFHYHPITRYFKRVLNFKK